MLILNYQILLARLNIATAFIILEHAKSLVFEWVFAQFFTQLILENNAKLLIVNQTHVLPCLV